MILNYICTDKCRNMRLLWNKIIKIIIVKPNAITNILCDNIAVMNHNMKSYTQLRNFHRENKGPRLPHLDEPDEKHACK